RTSVPSVAMTSSSSFSPPTAKTNGSGAAASVLLACAALFQFVDAGQVMALGVLRGLQDTRVPMMIAGVSYWLIGLPAGYVLAFVADLGAPGVWFGMVAGLTVAGGFLNLRLWRGLAGG
ncbi:MAG: MATE family efflux transporter, partial [Pseudomonadota bacterium]